MINNAIKRLRDKTGDTTLNCRKALELFDYNINKAYKYLKMIHNGVVYKNKEKKPFTTNDYIDYINNYKDEDKSNNIIGLHFEFNVGVEFSTQLIMTYEDIIKLVQNKVNVILEDEGLVNLGGKCDFIREYNKYGIKLFNKEE